METTNELAEAEKLLDAWTDESGDFGWMFSTSGALMGNKPSRDDLIKLIVRAKADATPPSASASQLAKDFPPMGGLTECDMGDSYE